MSTNFDPPFADQNTEKRCASASEQLDGFQCGEAPLALFNGLFNKIEQEFNNFAQSYGVDQTAERRTILQESVEAAIASITGSGNTANFVTLMQAQATLPIFPEILSADGRINVTSPAAGTVRIPGGVSFIHRGIAAQITTEEDFTTSASVIYHVRWSATSGYSLIDTTDLTYNPSGLDEGDISFDSTYDDMLIARVITNSSNVAEITNLENRPLLANEGVTEAISPVSFDNAFVSGSGGGAFVPGSGQDPLSEIVLSAADFQSIPVNWGRRPQANLNAVIDYDNSFIESSFGVRSVSRYEAQAFYQLLDNTSGAAAFIGYTLRA